METLSSRTANVTASGHPLVVLYLVILVTSVMSHQPDGEAGYKCRIVWCILFDFGPSRVRVLPLAAGRNEGGHNFRYFSFLLFLRFLGVPLFKTPEAVVVGFLNFA